MRHFAILVALTLSACALPGASGMGSFMTAMHPTQDFCASHGLTLDAATKQCVTPPQPPTEATGSLPPAPNGKPQPPAVQATGATPPSPNGKSQPPPVSPLVVPVQAPMAPAPSPPQERQQAAFGVPIEPDAVINPKFREDTDLMSELAHFVRASGYRCDSISALHPRSDSHGFQLVCDRSAYKYAIENKDGRWNVTVE